LQLRREDVAPDFVVGVVGLGVCFHLKFGCRGGARKM
jgi:hypothetical protein